MVCIFAPSDCVELFLTLSYIYMVNEMRSVKRRIDLFVSKTY